MSRQHSKSSAPSCAIAGIRGVELRERGRRIRLGRLVCKHVRSLRPEMCRPGGEGGGVNRRDCISLVVSSRRKKRGRAS